MATGWSEEAIGQAGAGLEPGRTAQSQRETPPLKIPLADWFRGGIREFARAYILEREDLYLSSSFIGDMWNQHQKGVRDRSSQLWNVLMFRLWLDKFAHR